MDCQEFEELSGAYALGALTPQEQQRADAHLVHCSKCQETYQELKGVVDLLPLTVPTVTPSPLLGERILATIQTREAHRTQTVHPPQPQRKKPAHWKTYLAIAAVLLLCLLGSLTAWNISLQQQLAGLSTPTTPIVSSMKSTNGTQGVGGEVIYFPQQHLMTLITHNLPQTDSTHVYQGWLIVNNHPRSIGLFMMQDGVAILNVAGTLKGDETAAVSLEKGPYGSQTTPQGPVVLAGSLKHVPQSITPANHTITIACMMLSMSYQVIEEGRNAHI